MFINGERTIYCENSLLSSLSLSLLMKSFEEEIKCLEIVEISLEASDNIQLIHEFTWLLMQIKA